MSAKKSLSALKTVQDMDKALPTVDPSPVGASGGFPGYESTLPEEEKLVLIMVGLPARGKSLIASKLIRYLRWLSVEARSFNVGSFRREDNPHPTADFFDVHNSEGEKARQLAAKEAIEAMVQWFEKEKGQVAILDATNSTKQRRAFVKDICDKRGLKCMFIESFCDDQEIITQNIIDVKTNSPDYQDMDPSAAIADFRARIKKYEAVYQTLDFDDPVEGQYTFVRIINVGQSMILNRCNSYLPSRIGYFLRSLHIQPRTIWLSRHGESEYNLSGKIGGDADLSARGQLYAEKLVELVADNVKDTNLTVWTSTLKRTQQTARFLPHKKISWKALDELDAGLCDGLTYEEIERKYPVDFKARDDDKYNYRYRGGESYRDVVTRLEPIIMELERQQNILIVTHQAVIRCLYAYLMNVPQDRSPWMEIPLHALIKLTPNAYGTKEERFKANIPAVSTFRAKFSSAKHQETDSPSAHEPLSNFEK